VTAQQTESRHVTLLGHIILILNKLVPVRIHQLCMRIREVTHTHFIVFGLIGAQTHNIPHNTRGKHTTHYTIDVVLIHDDNLLH